MRGVLVLVPATLFAKIIGLFYKIPLLHIVGVEGMAYFLSAYHVYSLLFVLSASGLPTALSLLISRAVAGEERRGALRILRVAMLVFLTLGMGGTALLALFATSLASRLAMPEAAAALVAIAPALLLSAFNGGAKGYFQGRGNMLPTALAEVLEAGGKLGFGLFFATLAKKHNATVAEIAAAAILGITAGVFLSALLLLGALLISVLREKRKEVYRASGATHRALFAELFRVAFPITVSASVMSLVSLIDTALISARLQAAGFAAGVANAMYSSYGNLAVPLYNLVPSLLSPLALSLTPTLGAAFVTHDREGARTVFSSGVRIAALVSIPASLGLCVFSSPILSMIYVGQDAAVSVAAPLLSLLALGILPAALISLSGAALQASGHAAVPVLSMLTGACVKLLGEVILLRVPTVHIYGAPISTLACNLAVLIINFAVLSRVLPFRLFAGRDLFRPLFAAVLSVLAGGCGYVLAVRLGALALSMPLTLVLAVLAFVPLALLLHAVEESDLAALPAGEKICAILKKCMLLKEVKQDDKRGKIADDPAKERI